MSFPSRGFDSNICDRTGPGPDRRQMSGPRALKRVVRERLCELPAKGIARYFRILEDISLNNNNRGNNNRRRGRGNNRQQGGGQPVNRIDSRARGNAQQMLDKYKKMAHDAHLNDDRVQEEYYLQFADHYFRVLADQKQRQDHARVRRDGAPQDGGGDRARFEDSRGRDYDSDDYEGGDDEQQRSGGGSDAQSEDRSRQDNYDDSGRSDRDSEGEDFEPVENPFVRDSRPPRSDPRPRKPRANPRPRDESEPQGEGGDDDRNSQRGSGSDDQSDSRDESRTEAGFDPSVLPPPIGSTGAGDDEEAPAKPRRRTRKPRATDGSDETLEVVG